ncbi:MAG TPA: TetR/AcrR family transcriptional regulator [Aliidongia sp.]|uniref:TetR/AcrR family transcriptional regulator n=1 Tax=Aliidongia sp. TaxID=1914230 RepID=UPI002DDD0873|nr:TetR/AcrR family transcriptional regulator [Aliidongia sp.]HEV2678234.1 TetR/AcrR family transcriptional regulator [Aliidongia sp.]
MGISERKARQKADLRARILEAARAIVLTDGFAGLTMRKIAQAIEYSPGTLYLHFAGRDEIARDLCISGFRDLVAALTPVASVAEPRARIEALAEAYVRFGLEQAETYRLIFMVDPTIVSAIYDRPEAGGPDDPGTQAYGLIAGGFLALQAAGDLAPTADPMVLTDVFWASLHGVVSLKLTCPGFPATPVEVLVPALVASLLDGMLA